MTKEETLQLFKQLLKQKAYLCINDTSGDTRFIIDVAKNDNKNLKDYGYHLRLISYDKDADNISVSIDMLDEDPISMMFKDDLDEALSKGFTIETEHEPLSKNILLEKDIDQIVEEYARGANV